ncbi:hypothetical protein KA005_47660 [bacterium]|nr:hypothetical protein [bacterium]
MEEDVAKLLLNGVPLTQFIAFYIAGVVGAIFSYGINVGVDVKKNTETPNKFSKRHFKVKLWRVIIAAISIAAGIIFNKEILGVMLSSETSIELTLWSSFGAGMAWDRLGKTVTAKKK